MEIQEDKIVPLFHELIDKIDDKAYLKKIYESLAIQFSGKIDFSDFEINQYNRSLSEVEKGNYFTNDQIKTEVKKWLRK